MDHCELARPAGLEPATPGLEVPRREATRGSTTLLPLISLAFGQAPDHPTPPRAATHCQSFVSRLSPQRITSASPRFAVERLSTTFGINGRSSASVLLAAINTITAILNAERFCWCWSFWSTVRNTSNWRSARCSSSPLRLLAHPISGAVRTSWPGRSRFRRRGRHSSRMSRTGEKRFFGFLQCGDGLFPGYRRKVFQEFGKRLSGFEVIDQIGR